MYCEIYCEMFQRFGITACEGCAGRRKERRWYRMIMGESVNAEQVLEDIERHRQVKGGVKFCLLVAIMVLYILVIF